MRRKFQILLTICMVAIFQVGIWTFTFIAKSYINKEIIEQAANDNKVIGLQLITLFEKTGLGENNPQTDSILQHICDEIKLPNGGFICAIDLQGNLVAGPGLKPGMSMPFDPVLKRSDNSLEVMPLKLGKEENFTGFANFKKEGRIDVVASIPINENLRLFVHQNTAIISTRAAKYVRPLLYIGLIVTALAGLIVFFSTNHIVVNYENKIEIQNEQLKESLNETQEKQVEILAQNDELEKQRNAITVQHDHIAAINKDVNDSILYAKRIQTATLPKGEIDGETIAEHFILFIPRDIVSGDFYWYHNSEDSLIIAAVDCTGHGVPGAFMSMIGITFLNEIVLGKKVRDAGLILDLMRNNVIQALDQDYGNGGASDGMDMVVGIIDKKDRTLQFAGAYNPMICVRNGSLIEIKGDRMPVGIYGKMKDHFTNHCINLEKNDVIYFFSDGYSDQFGGSKGRKFMTKNFKNLLLEIEGYPMESQKNILLNTIKNWQGDHIQVDDILVIGLKVN